jgi:hypothetical protein
MPIGSLLVAQITAFIIGWAGPWRDPPECHSNGRVAWPIRMGLSFSLVVGALLVWLDAPQDSPRAAYAGYVLSGMAASFIGDLIMARLIPTPNRLVGGMVAFAAAHALYIRGYFAATEAGGASIVNAALLLALLAYGMLTYFGWQSYIRNPRKPQVVNIGALVYGSWIAVMASFAFGLAGALGGAWWLTALGGLSFIASDFLIGVTDIHESYIENANDWIWLTYLAGQMGIIYAAAA